MEEFFRINPKYSEYIHENFNIFGRHLESLIKSKGLKVEEFEALHNFAGLNDIILGHIIPSDSTVKSLADALGVSEHDLVYES